MTKKLDWQMKVNGDDIVLAISCTDSAQMLRFVELYKAFALEESARLKEQEQNSSVKELSL